MAVGSGSPAPLKKVQRVQFGIFSPDELVSRVLINNLTRACFSDQCINYFLPDGIEIFALHQANGIWWHMLYIIIFKNSGFIIFAYG